MKTRLAYGLSVLFHPLLVPTYLVAMLCYGVGPTALGATYPHRLTAVGVAAGLTFVLPALSAGWLVRAGHVASLEMADRRQRPLPLLLAGLCFAAATVVFAWSALAAPRLMQLLLGITLALLDTLLITLRWKISAHAVGMGGAVGLCIVLLNAGQLGSWPGTGWLVAWAVLAAAVAWARLRLHAHTLAQVLAGLSLGFAAALGAASL